MIHLLLAVLAMTATPGSTSAQGPALFNVRCSSCHGLALQGSPNGPPLVGISADHVDFALRTGRMPAAVPGLQSLQKQPLFDDGQIRSIVRYVVSAGHGDSRLPQVAPGNIGRGRAVFAQSCQACHGVTAEGASVGYAIVAPSLMNAQSEQIAEAVRIGPGQMPKFGTDVLSARDVDDIVSYIVFLQTRRNAYNPGGLQLANIGPVAEGFVAWAFGLGLLVLFVRKIGSTD
ncbi:MAG: c-type cytochrome [Candidatus Eremiobacteraeota bacterium]|nr:c-type cytochrome [Candidatus Eremiobacteraeota bacterium]